MAEEEYDDYEEIPVEEKLAIVRYFINHCPPGHTKTVIEACKKLGCDEILDDDMVTTLLHEYNTVNITIADGPDGSSEKLVICNETEVTPTEYLHPSTGKVVSFNHQDGKSGAARDASADENPSAMSDKRTPLQAAVTEYVAKNYDKQGSGSVVTEMDGRLSVIISATAIKYSAYWSGRWKSEWTIVFEGAKATVEGTITVMAHYYEKGNVQMHNLKDVPSEILDAADPASFARAFVVHVKKTEDALHDEYQKMYTSMKDTTFKELRRTLPITGVRFPWHNPGLGSMANSAAAVKA